MTLTRPRGHARQFQRAPFAERYKSCAQRLLRLRYSEVARTTENRSRPEHHARAIRPLGVAFYLIFWAISSVDNALNVSNLLLIEGKHIYIPGLGILLVLFVLFVSGFIVTTIITDPIKQWFNRWINRLPSFKFLYSSIKTLPKPLLATKKSLTSPF